MKGMKFTVVLLLLLSFKCFAANIEDCLSGDLFKKTKSSYIDYDFRYSALCELTESSIDVFGSKVEVPLRSNALNLVFTMPTRFQRNYQLVRGRLVESNDVMSYHVAYLEIKLAPDLNAEKVLRSAVSVGEVWGGGREFGGSLLARMNSKNSSIRIESAEYRDFYAICTEYQCSYVGFSAEYGVYYILHILVPGDYNLIDWLLVRDSVRRLVSGVVRVN